MKLMGNQPGIGLKMRNIISQAKHKKQRTLIIAMHMYKFEDNG